MNQIEKEIINPYHYNKEDVDEEPIICIREINENIRRAKLDMPLTKPLKQLNKFCEFTKEWDIRFNIVNEEKIIQELKELKKIRRKLNEDLKEIRKPKAKERARIRYMKKYNEDEEFREKEKARRREKYKKDKIIM